MKYSSNYSFALKVAAMITAAAGTSCLAENPVVHFTADPTITTTHRPAASAFGSRSDGLAESLNAILQNDIAIDSINEIENQPARLTAARLLELCAN